MSITRKRFVAALINVLLLCFAFFIRYSTTGFLNIGRAIPLILLPLAISISIFYSENVALAEGTIIGIFMDSVSAESSIYNTLFMIICCVVCNLLSARFFNRNFRSALCLSAGMSFLYFTLKYTIFFAFSGVLVNYDYFTLYLIPSAVYTAVWILPFYLLNKKLSNY